MLPKSQRLNLKLKFKWVASEKSIQSKNFKLFYRFGDNPHPLIGVSIVSSKFKKAHQRNQAKRIMFNLAKLVYDQLHKGLNLVIMPNAQVLVLPYQELEAEFKNAISSLKIN